MSHGHLTTVARVGGIITSPVEHIKGQVVDLELACGHPQFGNPSMHYEVGYRARCWHTDHEGTEGR